MTDETEAFTLVFAGDIRSFKFNPLKTETPFGIPYAVGVGDAFAELEELSGQEPAITAESRAAEAEALNERLRAALGKMLTRERRRYGDTPEAEAHFQRNNASALAALGTGDGNG